MDRHGAIHDLFVVKSARRNGIARARVTTMTAKLEALGAPRLVLRTMVQNDPARRLAESLGFCVTMVEMTRDSWSSR